MDPNNTEEVCATKPIWPDAATVRHGPNAKGGRDLVAGDIHGHFATLEHALDALTFDPARDRLFGVGDLVDRDPRAENAIAWLEGERIKPVRGNHDQLMIGALAYDGGELLRSGPSPVVGRERRQLVVQEQGQRRHPVGRSGTARRRMQSLAQCMAQSAIHAHHRGGLRTDRHCAHARVDLDQTGIGTGQQLEDAPDDARCARK